MELWVRSQDKRILIKVDNVFLNANYDNKRISTYDGDSNTTLGEYKTKERALEVLDEIQNILKPQVITKLGKIVGKTCDGTIYTTPNEIEIKELSTYVYKMPED